MSRLTIFGRLVALVAQRIADHPSIPPANRAALRETAASVMEATIRELHGGEQLRIWVARPRRESARASAVQMLRAGRDPARIAAALGIQRETVLRYGRDAREDAASPGAVQPGTPGCAYARQREDAPPPAR